jgi:hypothetical protein
MKFALSVQRTSRERSNTFDISEYKSELKSNETTSSTPTKTEIDVKKAKLHSNKQLQRNKLKILGIV